MASPFASRLAEAERGMAAAGVPAMLITNPANLLYLCGFSGTAGRLLLAGGQLYFMTDFRYSRSVAALAASWPEGSQVIETTGGYDDTLARAVRDRGVMTLGFEPGHVTVASFTDWQLRLPDVRLVPVPGLVERLRVVKSRAELAVLREAGRRISEIAASLTMWVRGGRSEQEIAADINYAMARAGFSRPAFDTIVASGPNAALPHARPGTRRLTAGDLVVVDFGGVLDGYAVDITRTFSVGPPAVWQQQLHAAVLEAQAAAVAVLKPGARVQDVDDAARTVLAGRGYEGAVRHAVGHGLGLEVHEEPRLSRDAPADAAPLAAGMVVTIEPGAYVDTPAGGVRIEDDLVVTDAGPEWLTEAPRELAVADVT